MKTHRIANILDSNFIDLQGVTAMTIDEKIRLISKDFSTIVDYLNGVGNK